MSKDYLSKNGKESDVDLRDQLLHLLHGKGRLSTTEIADLLGTTSQQVEQIMHELEAERVILGYGALIDWSKARADDVTGLIEVRVTPQRGRGFDQIAKRIYSFNEVSSCYLMSGDYDLLVTVEGKTLREVAEFVSEKISVIDDVLSTRTHFILKKYKLNGHSLTASPDDEREVLVL